MQDNKPSPPNKAPRLSFTKNYSKSLQDFYRKSYYDPFSQSNNERAGIDLLVVLKRNIDDQPLAEKGYKLLLKSSGDPELLDPQSMENKEHSMIETLQKESQSIISFNKDIQESIEKKTYLPTALNILSHTEDSKNEYCIKYLYILLTSNDKSLNVSKSTAAERTSLNFFQNLKLFHNISLMHQEPKELQKTLIALDFIIYIKQKIKEEEEKEKELASNVQATPKGKKGEQPHKKSTEYMSSRQIISKVIEDLSAKLEACAADKKNPSDHIKQAFNEINTLKDLKHSIIFKHRKGSELWRKIKSLFFSPKSANIFNKAKLLLDISEEKNNIQNKRP